MFYFYINRVHPPKSGFYVPWNHFMECILLFLRKEGKSVEITHSTTGINAEDTVIFFAFDNIRALKGKKGNFIAISTEGFFSNIPGDPHYSRLKNKLMGINIKYIWDYTYININCKKFPNHIYVLPGYSRFLERNIEVEKDLDIVFYGGLSGRRNKMIDMLKKRLGEDKINIITTTEVNHLQMVKRAKIVIDIFYYEDNKPIDYYRIAVLLSNKVFVIHEDVQKEDKESDAYKHLSESLVFSDYENFVDVCEKWINATQEERDQVSEKTYQTFKKKFGLENFIKL